jgi:hypothetical protein
MHGEERWARAGTGRAAGLAHNCMPVLYVLELPQYACTHQLSALFVQQQTTALSPLQLIFKPLGQQISGGNILS